MTPAARQYATRVFGHDVGLLRATTVLSSPTPGAGRVLIERVCDLLACVSVRAAGGHPTHDGPRCLEGDCF